MAEVADGYAPTQSPLESHQRWKARARLEDQRKATFRSAAEGAFAASTEALEELPAFCQSGEGLPKQRFLNEDFAAALAEAVSLASDKEAMDEIAELLAWKLANSEVSRYEHGGAESLWPVQAEWCGLRARFHLAPSGLMTYSLGPAHATGAENWELSGEGCWRVLAADRSSLTEVVLEMRQGLQGSGPSGDFLQEPPRVMRVDIASCPRVLDEDATDADDDEEGDWDDEEGEDG
eukprot:TRINITY_DN53776_c0_g1_i1.p1 TRINITY_DN53776_c0_g1~~TRINITY_DN53776_c0_g1_i1.p1  ORF type:complete len:235 (-),score=60.68 TRINITY_DN53776_c0_g1_i1:91-795(-)